MQKHKKLTICLFLSLWVFLGMLPEAGATSITVEKKNGTCACDSTSANCSLQSAIDAGHDTIYVKPATTDGCAYYNPITVTSNVKLIGVTNNGKAWSTGETGCADGAPKVKYDGKHDPIVKFAGNRIEMQGFFIDTVGSAISATSFSGSRSGITLTYCTLNMDGDQEDMARTDKGIGVNYGQSVNYLSANYCKFIGQSTNTSNWFYVGDDGGGGTVDHVILNNNYIRNSKSDLQLNNTIKNILYSNNTFYNTWDSSYFSDPYYGYFLIEEPTDDALNVIRGITLTHNTFTNSTGSAPKEFGALIANNVEAADAGNNWDANLALHANNFLQDDFNQNKPIVGFQDSSYSASATNQISATTNYWGSGSANNSGPRLFSSSGSDTTRADVSSYVRYFKTWSRGQITGGTYASVPASSFIQEITGTEILKSNMSLKVTTNNTGAATFIPTRYTTPPTTTSDLSGAIAYFDLGIKSGGGNIGAITATFYAPSAMVNPYLYFYNGSQWAACSSFARKNITPTAFTVRTSDVSSTWAPYNYNGAVTYVITATKNYIGKITPTLYAITRTSISTPTRTFFALVGASTSSTTTSTPSGSSTTTTGSSSSGSGTTSTGSSTTTTAASSSSSSSSGGGTTTTTSRPSTTTTTATRPQLSVSPSALEFGDNDSAKQITIANTGTGTLNWEISDNETQYEEGTGWVFSASPQSGSVTNTSEAVTVLVSKRGLNTGTYSATLPVTSNGGNRDIGVTMSVAQQEFPVAGVRNQLLLFLSSDADEKTFSINNIFTGTLTWEIDTPVLYRGEGWLTVSPAAGYTRTETDTVKVTVDREGLGRGLYSATIPVRTNAGTNNVFVMMLNEDGPVIRIRPSILLYLSKTETEKTFAITNAGSGTLTWSIGTPEYHGGNGWVTSISPTSGSTETEPAEVTVTISREGLTTGLYRAEIPVQSNGKDRKVNVFLLISPFS